MKIELKVFGETPYIVHGSPPRSQKTVKKQQNSTDRHKSQVEAPDTKHFLCKYDLQMCDG
jgi:hypothetical protein